MQRSGVFQQSGTFGSLKDRLPPHTASSALCIKATSDGQCIWIDLADRMKNGVDFPGALNVRLLRSALDKDLTK